MSTEHHLVLNDEVLGCFLTALLIWGAASKEIRYFMAPKSRIFMEMADGDRWCSDFHLPLEEMWEVPGSEMIVGASCNS